MRKQLTIGLFGFGCVGTGLYEVLNQSNLLDAKIKRIIVKDRTKKRIIGAEHFGYEAAEILNDEEINLVVELINDSNEALAIVREALSKGKHVVSANKKLIAEHLDELLNLAKENNVSFLYEASVAGSIPIIRNLEEYYNNDSLSSVQGIVNGTTNYILTQANYGVSYADALQKAQELGFAEADPTLDVDGFDSKFKLVLLIKHAFGLTVQPENVFNYGIRQIKPQDVKYASEKDYRIKLFARAEKIGNKIVGFVAPHFIKKDHVAYQVDNEFNAVIVEASFSDRQLFLGKGAGSFPTASAVLSDISALQYDYQYEYKKSNTETKPVYAEDFYLKIYLASKDIQALNEIPFYFLDEKFQSSGYNYQTGWVKFSDLSKYDFNNIEKLFFAVLPESFKDEEEFLKFKAENEVLVNEIA
ncbi:MAG: homoserine dehydrogenase [Fluviicola sp.]|jgi:homoserine dehydrogenase|nr:homoserine dehydrogenase [Fluviicola sp.]